MTEKEVIAELLKQNAELRARAEEFSARNEELFKRLQQALERIKDLEAQLNANSNNSSKPPSSDGPKKEPAIPRKKGGKRGGKKGHKGGKLNFVANPDAVQVHGPTGNCTCGQCLSEEQVVSDGKGRQVFDLPEKLLKVVEHQVGKVTCSGCGAVHKGAFPESVRAQTQYGMRIRAFITMLSVEQSLPVKRICEAIHSMTEQQINPATVQAILTQTYESLADETKAIQDKILEQRVAHADETGLRVAGRTYWGHVLSNKGWTHLFVHAKRGLDALKSTDSITLKFRGILVSDFWGTYLKLANLEGNARCCAHIIRELRAISERWPEKQWAVDISAVLMYLYTFSEQGTSTVEPERYKALSRHYDRLVAQGIAGEPAPKKSKNGRYKRTKAGNLLKRLKEKKTEVLRFATDLEVPFTNNLAERDIRPLKTKLKVSTSFRTFKGARIYARIKGFCSTVRKQGLNVFQSLLAVLNGKPCFAVGMGGK